MAEKWTGDVDVPGTRRIGYAPEEIPADGEWYVLRSETAAGDTKVQVRKAGQQITQAISYIRRRQRTVGDWPGFEMARVKDEDEGVVTWHMLGRWT